ncbi:MAG: glycosyltransferase, partial [Firmicutes bacterium]|nr:glycosyltransferase [Bacillota bacterium]
LNEWRNRARGRTMMATWQHHAEARRIEVMQSLRISVIMPVLDEAARIRRQLQELLEVEGLDEILVVDGGSTDDTQQIVRSFAEVSLLVGPPGRGRQMNLGAQAATGEVLLFLHADVSLPPDAAAWIRRSLTDPAVVDGIGNAYSDEILHRARLSPFKLTQNLTDEEIAALHRAAVMVLTEWIERLRAEVGAGFPEKVTAFRPEMAVHGKYGRPCPVCGAPVQRIVYAENEANYCPGCQTGGRILADRALSRLLREDWPRTLEELESSPLARVEEERGRGEGDDPSGTGPGSNKADRGEV